MSVGVLDLLAEDQGHLEQEEVALAALADESLGVPHLEGVLQDELALGLQVLIEAWEETRRALGPEDSRLACVRWGHVVGEAHLPAWRGAWRRWLFWEH